MKENISISLQLLIVIVIPVIGAIVNDNVCIYFMSKKELGLSYSGEIIDIRNTDSANMALAIIDYAFQVVTRNKYILESYLDSIQFFPIRFIP